MTTSPRFTKVAVAAARARNVTIIEGAPDDTKLPSDCCDAMLLRPSTTTSHIHAAWTPACFALCVRVGSSPSSISSRLLAVPEGVPEDRGGHGMPIDVLIEEMTDQGFDVERRIDDWFWFDYCVLFRRRV